MGALIFDLDGTLIDSAPDLCRAANRVLASRGRSSISVDQARSFIGSGARVLIRHAFDATGGPPASEDDVHREFLARYAEDMLRDTLVYPEVVDTLTELAEDYALGLCTNKPIAMTWPILDGLGLRHFFGEAVIGGGSVARKKPHVEPVRAVLARLGETSGVLIGDSPADVGAARAAGLPCIAVSWGYSHGPPEALGADRLIDRFGALPEALRTLAPAGATRPGPAR